MTPCLHLLGPGSVCRHHCESHLLDIPTPPPLCRRGAPHQASGYPPHRRNGQLTMTRRVRVGVNVRHSKYNLITYSRDCSSFDPVSRLAPPGKKNLREKLGDAAWDNRGTGFISVTVCRVSGLPPTLVALARFLVGHTIQRPCHSPILAQHPLERRATCVPIRWVSTRINKLMVIPHTQGPVKHRQQLFCLSGSLSNVRAPNFAPPWLASYAEQRCGQRERNVELASASFRLRWTCF